MNIYLGIDIGSVSIKYALVNENLKILKHNYFRTHGDVIKSLQKILKQVGHKKISGVCSTGSGRKFVRALISADLDIDEITAHRTAISRMYPDVSTILEIGGQDSKLIYFSKNNIGFEMNNVCAAGTGSFLDQQAARLDMPIEKFCKLGLTTDKAHKIASKCTVFAESDMIHAQQSGIPVNQIIRGVHRGMINNYFSQLCLGKQLKGKFLFEGGTSENPLLVEEFGKKLIEEDLIESPKQLIVPKPYNKVIGAIGAAIICSKRGLDNRRQIPKINKFKFLETAECKECPNKCGAEITKIKVNDEVITVGKSCQN